MARDGVLVVGSITADVTAFSRRLPRRGETVLGDDFTLFLGGKGANQAVAAARAGAPTWMVGCVGQDPFRDIVLDGLREHEVHTSEIRTVPDRTGVAHIRVDASGENDIVITPLANARLTAEMVDRSIAETRDRTRVLLLQLEVPAEVTRHAAAAGADAGFIVVLDPAPAQPLPDDIWPYVDIVTPNDSAPVKASPAAVVSTGTTGKAGKCEVTSEPSPARVTDTAPAPPRVTSPRRRSTSASRSSTTPTASPGPWT